jgi:hypothetical protein
MIDFLNIIHGPDFYLKRFGNWTLLRPVGPSDSSGPYHRIPETTRNTIYKQSTKDVFHQIHDETLRLRPCTVFRSESIKTEPAGMLKTNPTYRCTLESLSSPWRSTTTYAETLQQFKHTMWLNPEIRSYTLKSVTKIQTLLFWPEYGSKVGFCECGNEHASSGNFWFRRITVSRWKKNQQSVNNRS